MYGSLSSVVIMLSSLIYRDLQDADLHIPIVKHHCHFLHFVWHNVPYQWKVLPFGLATTPRFFTALTKPILFLCHYKGFHIVSYLDDILVLDHSKWAGKRACLFLCCLLVYLGLQSIMQGIQPQRFKSLNSVLKGILAMFVFMKIPISWYSMAGNGQFRNLVFL